MPKNYAARRDQVNQIQKRQSAAGRDIAPLPKCRNRRRRKSCERNLKRFLETYFPEVFRLEWADFHLAIIEKIERAVLEGGLNALALPRASGKTSILIGATIWALLYGHRHFVVLIGASEDAAVELLDHIKADLESNSRLAEDFPEICVPIRALDGITHRAAGQLCEGNRTLIEWTAKQLTLPTIKGSKASGSIVKVAGITGRIRGMLATRPSDGASIRPDLCLIDDCQTDESAHSPPQVRRRLGVLSGAILGLAGPGKKIAGFAAVTVIAKNDVADQILDRKKHPEWQGERVKLLKSLPSNSKLWEEYAEHRGQSLREGKGIKLATELYQEHRAEMDVGAEASWSARHNPDEISAIQHAMNLKLQSEEAFAAEYQNEPLTLEPEAPLILLAESVTAKATNLPRYVVPLWATKLTAFIDVQKDALFYVVCGWSDDFTGHVLDYGAYPDQGRNHFSLREITKSLAKVKPNVAWEGQLYDGLQVLSSQLLARQWERENSGALRISRLIIDANWGDSTAIVKQFCRESSHSALLLPSHGRGITADRKPLNEYTVKLGERQGWNWRVMPSPEHHCLYDTNSWKTFVAQRWLSSPGEVGNLSIFKGTATQHQMFAEHVTAEYPTPTEGMGRTVNVWRLRPGRENHFLDCLIGCAVAASEQGVLFVGHQKQINQRRKRRKLEVTF